ncbi:DUF5615 domain-containing protein [Deinococcus saxicola]|uniref:DUF5615 family PIN-like protein n=1 Tax=Deinococcus saxicola TaxID=249406 RepID=UPI0039EECC7E
MEPLAGKLVYWIDAQLPPQLAPWLTATFGVEAYSAGFLGYRDATDETIFLAARTAGAVIISKDADFLERVIRLGTPPQLLYVTCGNTSKSRLTELLAQTFAQAHTLFLSGEAIVEVA